MRICLAVLATLVVGLAPAGAAAGEVTIELDLRGQRLVGRPVTWSSSEVFLLARDGRLWNFPPTDAANFRQVATGFRGYNYSELRGELAREFDRRFEVSGAGRYIVVHPAGQRDHWASRFEQLYRSFQHYFTARGFPLREPEFPLVAVVFPRQEDFLRYAARESAGIGPGVLGYYSPTTNRVLLYDAETGVDSNQWTVNAATIIHEATHQTAFNTGVHNRFAPPPRWLAEGLGTMFEAPGVHSSRHHPHLADRINPGRLAQFRRYLSRRQPGSLMELVSSDRPFQSDPDGAYAEAWALTFYLVEREPQKLARYVARTNAREPFSYYAPARRWADFASEFGENVPLLEARLQRFVAELP